LKKRIQEKTVVMLNLILREGRKNVESGTKDYEETPKNVTLIAGRRKNHLSEYPRGGKGEGAGKGEEVVKQQNDFRRPSERAGAT